MKKRKKKIKNNKKKQNQGVIQELPRGNLQNHQQQLPWWKKMMRLKKILKVKMTKSYQN